MTKRLTTTGGAPVPTNDTSKTAGPRGPLLLEDYQLIEKLAHQNRERIPERTVHAKGWGAIGTFTVTHDISHLTRAKLFSKVGEYRTCCRAGPPWPAKRVRPTPSATCGASR